MLILKSKDGKIINKGDEVKTFRGETIKILDIIPPMNTSSSNDGRMVIESAKGLRSETTPKIINAIWIKK